MLVVVNIKGTAADTFEQRSQNELVDSVGHGKTSGYGKGGHKGCHADFEGLACIAFHRSKHSVIHSAARDEWDDAGHHVHRGRAMPETRDEFAVEPCGDGRGKGRKCY